MITVVTQLWFSSALGLECLDVGGVGNVRSFSAEAAFDMST